MTEPAEFTTAKAATTTPLGSVTLAVPTPPWRPRDRAPVPAPTAPSGDGRGPGSTCRTFAERLVGAVPELPGAAEVEDHGAGHDGHHIVISRTDLEADAAALEVAHHAACRRQAVGAAAGEADRVHGVHRRGGVQQFGVARAGSAAPHVDAGSSAGRQQHDARARSPAPSAPLVVPQPDAGDIGEATAAGHDRLPCVTTGAVTTRRDDGRRGSGR